MDIILLDYIEKVGDKHDVVKVRDGFGRNYLIPKGLAIVANKTNMARLDGLKKQAAKKETAMLDTYRALAAKLAGASIQIESKAGESGRLFGSVTTQNFVDAIRDDLGVTIEKRMVIMPEEVKELGAYEATVKFHPEVIEVVKFEVVRDKKLTTGGNTTTGSDDTADRQVEAPVEAIVAAPVVEEIVEVAEEVAEVVEAPVEMAAEAVETAEETVEEVVEAMEETVEETVDTMEAAAEETVETPVAEVEAAVETVVEEVETVVEDSEPEVVAEAATDEAETTEDEADKA